MNMNPPASKIIIALDVDSRDKALSLVRVLEEAGIFKVGLKLFTLLGPFFIHELHENGKKVFLDLKLHDIPNTVAGAVFEAVKHGVHMMTLHASGGSEMMTSAAEAASQAAKETGNPRPILLAVTVLTSLQQDQLDELGISSSPLEQVLRLARLAKNSGMDGVVCSPREIDGIRRNLGREFLVAAPGIRPRWAEAHDQKRIMTPLEAFRKGADYIVIGRPVIAAPSPGEAFRRIIEELAPEDPG